MHKTLIKTEQVLRNAKKKKKSHPSKNTFPRNLRNVMTAPRGGACCSGSCARRVKCVWQESEREEGAAAHEWKSASWRDRHHFPPRVQSVNRGEANAVNYLAVQQQDTQSTGCRWVYQPRARGAPATSDAQSIQKGECEWLERTGFN